MRKIVLEKPGKFVTKRAPEPAAAQGEALIRMERVGVCGSDFHAFTGSHPVYTYPRVLGHELSGVVVEAPENSRGIKAGDRCAIEPYLSCGECRACARGRNNCCENIRLFGIHIDGGMQEFLSVPISLLHKSDRLSLDQLALVETLGIGAHAVTRGGVQQGQQAIVVGAGPVGIAVAQFAVAAGAAVHVIEKNDWRRRFVEKMGYSAASEIDHRQADVVFDATGNPHAMGQSLASVAPTGNLVFVGLTNKLVPIDDALFHKKEVTLYSSRNSFGLFPRIIRLIEKGDIDTSAWITERLALEEVPSRFEGLTKKKSLIKAIISVNGD